MKGASSHEKTWRKRKCTLPSERSQSEDAISSMITNIRHSGEANAMETVRNQWLPGVREGMMSRWSTEDF